MKRLLVLLTVMVAVLFFTAGAFAQTVCTSCKGTLREIPCPVGAVQGAACTLSEFDYDINSFPPALLVPDGYCSTAVGTAGVNNYRAIFHICDCPDPTVFTAGLNLQVRYEILVNGLSGANGAYWSGTAPPATLNFNTAASTTLACGLAAQPLTFGAYVGGSFFQSDGATVATPLAGVACTVGAANRATIWLSNAATPYVVTGLEGSYWWFDIPPIRISTNQIQAGDVISVQIRLIDVLGASICAECTLCDCTIEVARVCCSGVAPTTMLTFNYFTSLAAGDYWNGMAIANNTGTAGTCVLTARQLGGGACTATVTVPANGLVVDLLENMTWTGTVNGAPCFIIGNCDYAGAFGFGMMANGAHDSMGYATP